MAITATIPVLPGTTESITLPQALKGSEMGSVTQDPLIKDGSLTRYVLVSGSNPGKPVTVTYRTALVGKAGQRRISVNLDAYVALADSVTGQTSYQPVSAFIGVNSPVSEVVTPAMVQSMLGHVYSYTFFSATAGVPATSWLNALMFGMSRVK